MNKDMFLKTIAYYGEENILAIGFDNSAGTAFEEGEFTLENCWVDEIESLHFVEYDICGRPFHVIKHVSHVQNICVRDDGTPFKDYVDKVSLRG